MEQRNSARIPVSLTGFLQHDTGKIHIQVINLSSGGACIAMDTADFAKLEKADHLQGCIQHRKEAIAFRGTVCWTSTSGDLTQTGISFQPGQPQLTNLLLQLQPQKEDEPRDGQFFI